MGSKPPNDALGYLDDLREAVLSSTFIQLILPNKSNVGKLLLAARWEASLRVAEQTPEVCDIAVAVISSLGFCRIYGISVPPDLKKQLKSPLPIELLAPAIFKMLRLLELSTEDARSLPSRFDNSEAFEDLSHCTSILHSLMELWAMYIIIDDEYRLSLKENTDVFFEERMHRLLDAFTVLDAEVQGEEQLHILSIVTELPLLDNWRKMLAKPYRKHLPWWLDGTLEEAATQVRRSIMNEDIFGEIEPKVLSFASALPISARSNFEAFDPVENFVLAAATSGLLGEVTNIVANAALGLSLDPLGILRNLEIDEPRLRTNPVWCLDQLAAVIQFPAIKRHLLDIFVKHQIFVPASVVEEILKSDKET